MKTFTRILALTGALTLFPTFASPLFADGDTSADASRGFGALIQETKGVILRVPINAQGEENTNAVEVRFVTNTVNTGDSSTAVTLWDSAKVPPNSAEFQGTNAPDRDSSTWGWYNWYGYGWRNPYYYYSYYPTYYYYGNYYSYRPYWYYNSYYGNYWYRYYYYYY